MSGFVLTIESDDDVPTNSPPPKSRNSKSSSNPKSRSTASSSIDNSTKKGAPKPGAKLTKKQLKAQKKRLLDVDVEQGESSEEEEQPVDEDELGRMDKGFVFDGLGGGFVGRSRNDVWDSGESYLQKRPNAIPRVTVDEIIARRAPEREAKAAMKEAQALLDESDDEDLELDDEDLEAEMMKELEEGDWEGVDEGSEGDEEDSEDDDEEEADKEGEESDEGVEPAKRAPEFEENAEENWLGIGEKSEGEDQEDDDEVEDGSASSEEEEEEEEEKSNKPAAKGFAALAELEDADMSDAISSHASDDDEPLTTASKADAAAAKSFFTAHKSTSGTTAAANKQLTFSTLPNCTLSRQLLLALGSLNLSTPTPIQAECIPLAMMGKDIVASSATGSGKTVAFWVGVLERLLHRDRKNPATRVVVMCPTRELAVQVHGVGKALARYTDVSFCLCVGGLSLKVQEAELKQRPDIVVSTPGRLIDHVRNTPCFTMDGVEVLVLDEADRMLEEGFRDELEEIITAAPRSRQTLLFSATVTESISALSRLSMSKPTRVKIDEMGAAAKGLEQEFLRVRGDKAGESIEFNSRSGERHREALLVSLCTRSFATGRTIIFFRSKAQAHRMKILFTLYGQGLERSDELHGDLTQEQRLASLKKFREGEIGFLLATDLASRGLDIKGIENVINYEMPRSIDIYLHRVGRTARAGKKGRALTLVGESDRKLVKLAMKHAPPESVKQRTVPADVVNATGKQLKDMDGEVRAVVREEQEEKEFRRGNMEITKASNLLEHAAEIKGRPARTWFQSTSEKNASKTLGTVAHNASFQDKLGKKRQLTLDEDAAEGTKAPKRTPFSGLSRREKRRKMAMRDEEDDRETGDFAQVGASIRAAKKANRPAAMTFAAPERERKDTPKKKKKGGSKFDREMGVAQEAKVNVGKGKERVGRRERDLLRGGSGEKPRKQPKHMGPKEKRN